MHAVFVFEEDKDCVQQLVGDAVTRPKNALMLVQSAPSRISRLVTLSCHHVPRMEQRARMWTFLVAEDVCGA